jgi:cytochrome c-type biogenesis protein
MDDMGMALGSALWLGFLTSISPCPLATNVAAMSYVSRGLGSPCRVLMTGLVYTAGRSLAYLVLGILMVASLLTAPGVSLILQERMNQILGPALILAGVLLLELIRLPSRGGRISAALQGRAERWGIWGGGLLGLVFALSFCPTSAGLFFGSLIPLDSALSLRHRDCHPGVRIRGRFGNRSERRRQNVRRSEPI